MEAGRELLLEDAFKLIDIMIEENFAASKRI